MKIKESRKIFISMDYVEKIPNPIVDQYVSAIFSKPFYNDDGQISGIINWHVYMNYNDDPNCRCVAHIAVTPNIKGVIRLQFQNTPSIDGIETLTVAEWNIMELVKAIGNIKLDK